MDKITVKVDLKTEQAIVRRVYLDVNGCVEYKTALNKDGDWIMVPEGARYPSECILSVVKQAPKEGENNEQA